MALWETIRDVRLKHGLSREEFANRLGKTAVHINKIETPYSKSKTTASEDLLKKIATLFSQNNEEKLALEQRLILEKIAIRAPKALRERIGEELKPYLSSLSDESMPPTFINKLRNDISAVANMDVFFSSLAWLPPVEIEKVLGGKRLITSTQVIELAQAMGKPIDDYLIAAGYIPEHLQNLVNDKRTAGVLNSLSKKKPEVINKVLSIIETVLGMDMEKKR